MYIANREREGSRDSVTARKRHKAQISRRRRTVCDLLDSAYIRGSKAKERRRREEGKGAVGAIYTEGGQSLGFHEPGSGKGQLICPKDSARDIRSSQ